MSPIIHWFRRDLRLRDNTALAAAARDSGGAVIPVFVLDDRLLSGRFAAPLRNAFLFKCLRSLDADLRAYGLHLVLRRGDPRHELPALARESGAAGVYWNRDYTPYATSRDTAIVDALRAAGLEARSFKDAVAFEADEVTTRAGGFYAVYTPYARRWRELLAHNPPLVAPFPELATIQLPEGPAIPEPDLPSFQMPSLPEAGEAAAMRLLDHFVQARRDDGIIAYAERRDLPGEAGTSRLSPHLHLGTLSVRQCLRAALDSAPGPGPDTWIGELIWRDFYIQIIQRYPHVLGGAFKREYDGLAWQNDPELFAAWQEGRTGYPLVDAAMRQLRQEGWMHNRARMVVASFLTKDLLIDWRWGERYFMQQLIDGDLAANNGGWQWAAGTGTDAQPYFRIFNPVSQGEKFDPDGVYVRRYLPELANVPKKYIHCPHQMAPAEQIRADVQIGRDYPRPIVDHQFQRRLALALYGAVRRSVDS